MAKKPAFRSSTQRLERLLEISRNLSSTLDLQELLQMIVDEACELTLSEAASILLHDPATGELRFEAAPGFQRDTLSQVSVPLDSSIARKCSKVLYSLRLLVSRVATKTLLRRHVCQRERK